MPLEATKEQHRAIEAIEAWLKGASQKADFITNGKDIWPTARRGGEPFLLDGGPGVGKTTTAALAIQALKLKRVVFGAYTAKAARVMEWKGMKGACTLHWLLYKPELDTDGRIKGWRRNDNSPCRDAQLIVIDECSMVSDQMADELKSFEKPILVLGDVEGQLPPIQGLGAFTRRQPDFRLAELHRTAEDSPIAQLVWRARRGASLSRGGPPECCVEPLAGDAAWDLITNRDWQVICGKHTTRQTVIRRARARYGFSGSLPAVGEPLICCRNNYQQGLINGDLAVLWRITENDPDKRWFKADLLIDGETRTDISLNRACFRPTTAALTGEDAPPYDRSAYFDFAYAITAHKAQGSEFERVVVIDDQFAWWDRDLRRRWLTTALSRASEKLHVFTTG